MRTSFYFPLKHVVIGLLAFSLIALSISSPAFAAGNAKNLVRIQVTNKTEAGLLPRSLDVVGQKPGEWVEAVVTDQQIQDITDLGLFVQILSKDVDALMREAQESYPTWADFQSQLSDIVTNHSSICMMDTIGTTYEGRPIQVVKLSDNVTMDEAEPEVLYTGLTHAREWPGLVTTMFILDSLTSAYGLDPAVTTQVNSREIFFIPCMNPDGYAYSHDVGVDWRKNRRPFPEYGSVGVDLNRNYGGSVDGNPEGEWGTTIGSITHQPSDATYCGPYPFSEAETSSERDFIESRDFCAGISYHTHGELVLWPWGYGYYSAPNESFLSNVGIGIAALIQQEDYSGTYLPEQAADLYPTSGDATDWGYGNAHFEVGRDFIFYTIEECQQFQPPTSHLAQIVRENFDGAFYLLQQAGTIRIALIPRVIPPVIADIGSVPSGDYTVEWSEVNPLANPTRWQIDELSDVSVVTDDVEGTTDRWELGGFSVSTARSHSSSHSFKSSHVDETADGLTSTYPYYVEPDDSLTFWLWYDIENLWDYGYVEVSLDDRKFDILELYTGSATIWTRHAISLEDYVGKSIFIRFRYTTDTYTLEEGMYVDDIYPAVFYNTVTTLDANVTDESYSITGQAPGTYYYRVRGYNPTWFWCDYSTYEPAIVSGAAAGTVAGTVTDSISGSPLDGITVEVLDSSSVIGSDVTVAGAYEITGITPGTYDVMAGATVYAPKTVTGVTVTDGNTTNVDFELVSIYGSVKGTVKDSILHVALSGVTVQLAQGSDVITTSTDSSGNYSFANVEGGNYSMTATHIDYQSRYFSYLVVTPGFILDNSFDMMPTAICGDADGSGAVDIDDAVFLITYIFASGPAPSPIWTGDADCSGEIDIDDVVYLIAYIFSSGPAPCASC